MKDDREDYIQFTNDLYMSKMQNLQNKKIRQTFQRTFHNLNADLENTYSGVFEGNRKLIKTRNDQNQDYKFVSKHNTQSQIDSLGKTFSVTQTQNSFQVFPISKNEGKVDYKNSNCKMRQTQKRKNSVFAYKLSRDSSPEKDTLTLMKIKNNVISASSVIQETHTQDLEKQRNQAIERLKAMKKIQQNNLKGRIPHQRFNEIGNKTSHFQLILGPNELLMQQSNMPKLNNTMRSNNKKSFKNKKIKQGLYMEDSDGRSHQQPVLNIDIDESQVFSASQDLRLEDINEKSDIMDASPAIHQNHYPHQYHEDEDLLDSQALFEIQKDRVIKSRSQAKRMQINKDLAMQHITHKFQPQTNTNNPVNNLSNNLSNNNGGNNNMNLSSLLMKSNRRNISPLDLMIKRSQRQAGGGSSQLGSTGNNNEEQAKKMKKFERIKRIIESNYECNIGTLQRKYDLFRANDRVQARIDTDRQISPIRGISNQGSLMREQENSATTGQKSFNYIRECLKKLQNERCLKRLGTPTQFEYQNEYLQCQNPDSMYDKLQENHTKIRGKLVLLKEEQREYRNLLNMNMQ